MINTFSFEGFCYRDSHKSYYFKSKKGNVIFLCNFSLNFSRTRYLAQYVLFLNDTAVKVYEQVEEGKAYLITGSLYISHRMINLKYIKGTDTKKDYYFFKGLIPLGEEVYLTKSKRTGRNHHKMVRENIELKQNTNKVIRPVITDSLSLIAGKSCEKKYKKLIARPEIKKHLNGVGIVDLDDDEF